MAGKAQGLYTFWSGFGLPAYDENSVPDDAEFPYITYETRTGSFGDEIALSASLWYKSMSWAAISDKADEIAAAIGSGGTKFNFSGGAAWIKRGSTFAQRMGDNGGDLIKRIYLSVQAEFMSAD